MKQIGPLLRKKGPAIHLLRARHAKTMGPRFWGLMGVSPEDFDYALVFHLAETGRVGASIHMLFMRMPIDLLFLDENQKTVDAVENLPPWTLNYTPRAPARFVVELPAGTILKYELNKKMGEKITWDVTTK